MRCSIFVIFIRRHKGTALFKVSAALCLRCALSSVIRMPSNACNIQICSLVFAVPAVRVVSFFLVYAASCPAICFLSLAGMQFQPAGVRAQRICKSVRLSVCGMRRALSTTCNHRFAVESKCVFRTSADREGPQNHVLKKTKTKSVLGAGLRFDVSL